MIECFVDILMLLVTERKRKDVYSVILKTKV